MKKFIVLISILVSMISCKKAIKNEEKLVVENTFEEIQFVEPEITNSNSVNTVNDLLGYWVGNFEADISKAKMDSIQTANQFNLLNRKITFSIDKIDGDSIFGHSVVVGNITPFKGLISQKENQFSLKVDEFNKTKYDGFFEINITKNDTILNGNWFAYSPKELNISKRKFKLQKQMFEYKTDNILDYLYTNDEKFKKTKYTDTIDDKVEQYEDYEYYTTTPKLLDKNPSKDILTKEFVANLTKADIFILRNSIFARHGFAFRDKQLRIYFESYQWYMPVFGDVKDDLTELEKKNIDLLLRYEKNATEYYDTFGR